MFRRREVMPGIFDKLRNKPNESIARPKRVAEQNYV